MKRFVSITTIILLALIVILALMPYWPQPLWWLANMIQLGPFYLLFVPLGALFLASLFFHQWKTLTAQILCALLILFGIMGFQWHPAANDWTFNRGPDTLRVLSMNIGRDKEVGIRLNHAKFMDLIKETRPDIIALQEAGHSMLLDQLREAFPERTWYGAFQNGFTLISTLPVRKAAIEWDERASAIQKYQVTGPDYLINYFNIHFMTPRYGMEAIINKGLAAGKAPMQKVTRQQRDEARAAARLIQGHANVIISGDFNITPLHPIYRRNWAQYTNAFSAQGNGFGHSKFFLFHGVRIDHVLCDDRWEVLNAKVGPSLDSDHRPLIVDLKYTGPQKTSAAEPAHRYSDIELIDFSRAFYFEEFEANPGRFESFGTGYLSIDHQNAYTRGYALKIEKRPNAEALKAGAGLDLWDIRRFGRIKFSYKIPSPLPEKVPVCLKVQTRFNDWITVAGVFPDQCDGAAGRPAYSLIADNQWHEADIRAAEAVRSVLPAIKYLQGVRFTIDHPAAENNLFWIDDFRVTTDNDEKD